MTEQIAVSVVLPVRNGARYLAQSIDSILGQSFGDFELITIDDGSTDATAEILRGYQRRDARLRIITQQQSGLVAALNRGCAAARGAFIARMDADDVALPNRFELQIAFLRSHPRIAAVSSAVTYIDPSGRPIGARRVPCRPSRIARALRSGDNTMIHPAVMMRRAAFEKAGGYNQLYRHAEDYELWLRMADHFLLANLPQKLLLQRIHGDSVGARYRLDQIQAARSAVAVSRLRREDKPDPVAALHELTRTDLARIPFSAREWRTMQLDVGEVALQAARDPGAASVENVLEFARMLCPEAKVQTPVEAAVAMMSGGGGKLFDRRTAHRMVSLARHFADAGDWTNCGYWLMRGAAKDPFGPIGVLGLAVRRAGRLHRSRRQHPPG